MNNDKKMIKKYILFSLSNDRFQPLSKAAATEERTLEAVGCKPVLNWRYHSDATIAAILASLEDVYADLKSSDWPLSLSINM